MSWLRLHFDCGPSEVEAASVLLQQFGAEAVSVAPLGEALFEESAGTAGYASSNRVSALLAPDADLDILLACLKNRIGPENLRNAGFESVADRDWNAEVRAAHGPLCFGTRLCICPSWAQPAAAERVLYLDPGLAFGTGSHATTAQCLDWLVRADLRGRQVIDYGCGSGVLALSAALLGAQAVYALDIDPEAVAAARENAARNGLSAGVHISVCGEDSPPAADILLANILLGPLVKLAPTFATLLKPQGRLVLSGLLATQVEECAAAYRPWFRMGAPQFRDEWAMLAGVRGPDGSAPEPR